MRPLRSPFGPSDCGADPEAHALWRSLPESLLALGLRRVFPSSLHGKPLWLRCPPSPFVSDHDPGQVLQVTSSDDGEHSLFRQAIPANQISYCLQITLAVHVFTLFDGSSHWSKGSQSNSLFGILLLLINLFIDGLMNSWQDELFQKWRAQGTACDVLHESILSNTLDSLLGAWIILQGQIDSWLTFLVFIKNYTKMPSGTC